MLAVANFFDNYYSRLDNNCSIVQGSGIGPSIYIFMETDLHTLCNSNAPLKFALCNSNASLKFADDTSLLVAENYEVAHPGWARCNKMMINYSKTKEIVLHLMHLSRSSVLPSLCNTELVHNAKLVEITLPENLTFKKHVQQILACCSKRFYLPKRIRDGGMPINKITCNVIFCSPVVNRSIYSIFAGEAILVLNK
jgi:hypothetical protein